MPLDNDIAATHGAKSSSAADWKVNVALCGFPGNMQLFSLHVGECGLSGVAYLSVAVLGKTFERSYRRRGGGQTERFDCRRAQRRRSAPEQAAARLRKLDERLHRGRTADAPERENQLAFHPLILFLFHGDDERHGERVRLAPADAEGSVHADFGRLVS